MGPGTKLDNGPTGPIVNEVLCFIINKWGNIDINVLTRLCIATYDDKEIENAKDVLFSVLHDENDKTEYTRRRAGRKPDVKTKKEKNLQDMFSILEEKGDVTLPDFVARDLGNLPPITFDSIDVSVLLRKIDNLECTVNLLKDSMNKVTNSNKGLCEVYEKLSYKVSSLETIHEETTKSAEHDSQEQSVQECEKVIDKIVEELKYVCTVCDVRFQTDAGLLEHQGKKHPDVIKSDISCKECEFKCDSQEELLVHTATHIPYRCDICDKSFFTENDFDRHMIDHTGEGPFKCDKCEYVGFSESLLKTHNKIHVTEDIEEQMQSILEMQMQNLTLTEKRPYKCNNCEFSDSYIENLKLHLETHKGEKPSKCPKCDFRYYDRKHLEMHMNEHMEEKLFKCEICDSTHRNEEDLKIHIGSHKEDKPYKCNICDFSFSLRENLTMHMKLHMEVKPFKCEKCDFTHTNKENLKMHMEVHKSETPIIESVAAFPQLGSKTQDVTDHKPYVCHICEHRFSTQVECKQHVRTHKPEENKNVNACYLCDKRCATVDEMKKHIAMHTEEKLFQCTDCDFVSHDEEEFKLHMRVHMGENVANTQNVIDSQLVNDGWSLPFYNGKPMKPKDYIKQKQKQNHPGPQKSYAAIIGTGKGVSQAIENMRDPAILFASRFKPSSNANTVKKDLESNLLKVTGVRHIVTVEKRPTRYDHYASYKISSFCNDRSVFLNPEVWPAGIIVRWWRQKLSGNNGGYDNHNNNNSGTYGGYGYPNNNSGMSGRYDYQKSYGHKGSRSNSITGDGY